MPTSTKLYENMMRNGVNSGLTVEVLSQDCLHVRDLCKMGALKGEWATFRPIGSLRWPAIRKIRAARYLVQIELHNQTLPQQIRISWTFCHLGGERPWIHCPHCEKRVAKLLKGMGGIFAGPASVIRCMPLRPRAAMVGVISSFARSGCSSMATPRH
jgi:hypothetical protein